MYDTIKNKLSLRSYGSRMLNSSSANVANGYLVIVRKKLIENQLPDEVLIRMVQL